jgi:hypothetical protein
MYLYRGVDKQGKTVESYLQCLVRGAGQRLTSAVNPWAA